jgi:hypothetical protein
MEAPAKQKEETVEQAAQAVVNYIKGQEVKWGQISTPCGPLLVLLEHELNPLVNRLIHALHEAGKGKADKIVVTASDPVEEVETPSPFFVQPRTVSGTGMLSGRSGLGA